MLTMALCTVCYALPLICYLFKGSHLPTQIHKYSPTNGSKFKCCCVLACSPENPSNVNVVVPDGSSVVAAALTLAATSPDPPLVGGPSEQPYPQKGVVTSASTKAPPQNAPRFTFFDYSLIPDKDPRAFVRNHRDGKNN